VVTSYLAASFSVLGGQVIGCAPVLRKRFAYWATVAERIGPVTEADKASAP
jgi:hypothetical protein